MRKDAWATSKKPGLPLGLFGRQWEAIENVGPSCPSLLQCSSHNLTIFFLFLSDCIAVHSFIPLRFNWPSVSCVSVTGEAKKTWLPPLRLLQLHAKTKTNTCHSEINV